MQSTDFFPFASAASAHIKKAHACAGREIRVRRIDAESVNEPIMYAYEFNGVARAIYFDRQAKTFSAPSFWCEGQI